MMSLFAPENSPASSVLPPVGNTTPRAAAAAPSPVTDPPSPMAVPPPEINAPPVIAPPLLLPPILPPENSSTPPAPALIPPEILTPSPSPPVPPPEISPPPTSQPDNPPEISPPLLSPPVPPPEISPPSPENAPPPSGELAAPPALADKFPPPPPKSVPMNPSPINNISPPTGTTPAKPQPEPRTTPTSPPPVSTVNLPPRNPDRPVKSPGTRVPPSPPHVATPAKPNVPALETPPPNYQTGSVPPASSLQPPELHGSSVPPALSSNVSSPSSVVPPLNPGDLSPPGSNGGVPMSIGDERASVGRSSISKGIAIGGIIGGILIVAVIGWLVCVYLKGRNRRKKGDKGCNRVPLAGSKGDADLPPNLKQNVSPPASHVVTVLASSLPSPSLEGKVGDSSLANSVQSPRALGVKFGILSDWFTYDELVKATDNFSQANLIGQGGFGHVYKGVFPSGKEVAVKQLNVDSKQGEREFQAEVETISRVHHKHLVSLIGYCITGSDRLLVYEFVPNNTLEFHLHRKKQPVMDWTTRMRIAIGSAKGLAYLHEDCQPAIIHRDIKASNILLDFKFEAKVSDFGLAKSFPDNGTSITHISTRVMGTFGYLAPEYASSGQVTERSDVYSYGVMLLELLTGRPPISTSASLLNESLVGWAWPLLIQSLEDGIYDTFVDPKLLGCYNSNEMIRMVACATACVQHSARLRPRMSQVTRALEGDISFTDIIEGIQARYVFYGSSESSRYDVHQYNNQRKKFERILASQEHAATGYSQSTSEYGLHPSDSSSESRNYQRPKESVASNDDIC